MTPPQILIAVLLAAVLLLAVVLIVDKVRPIRALDDVPQHEGADEDHAAQLAALPHPPRLDTEQVRDITRRLDLLAVVDDISVDAALAYNHAAKLVREAAHHQAVTL